MNKPKTDVLETILKRKREEIAERVANTSREEVIEHASLANPARGFIKALAARVSNQQTAVIAEIKKASPSKGVIRENFNPVAIAKSYAANGATCLSILTDADFFQGSEKYLMQARSSCDLPVLRKDFIIDPYQVYESRAINADCILLIVAALDDTMLKELLDLTHQLGMDALVEVHDEAELKRAIACGAKLIGINNRNLRTFEITLDTTLSMLAQIPEDCLLVTESGIHTPDDVKLMRDNGVYAFLVGEAFMRATDPGARLAELFA
jgi:indole-3-glycerol phosphate synthase